MHFMAVKMSRTENVLVLVLAQFLVLFIYLFIYIYIYLKGIAFTTVKRGTKL